MFHEINTNMYMFTLQHTKASTTGELAYADLDLASQGQPPPKLEPSVEYTSIDFTKKAVRVKRR